MLVLLFAARSLARSDETYDVVVIGGSSGGIGAARTQRCGRGPIVFA